MLRCARTLNVLILRKGRITSCSLCLTHLVPSSITAQKVLEDVGSIFNDTSTSSGEGDLNSAYSERGVAGHPKKPKSKIPALAPLSRVAGKVNTSGSTKKGVLVSGYAAEAKS